jgi:hypothetical protein
MVLLYSFFFMLVSANLSRPTTIDPEWRD